MGAFYRYDGNHKYTLINKGSTSKSNSGSKNTSNKSSNSGNTNSTPANTNNNSSEGKTETETRKIELRYLEGSLSIIPMSSTLKIHAGDTINLKNLGINLSGNYYVKSITKSYTASDGITLSLEVLKPNWGSDRIKIKTKKAKKKKKENTGKQKTNKLSNPVKAVKATNSLGKTYTVKNGDTFYSISKLKYKKSDMAEEIAKLNDMKVKDKLKVGQKIKIY